VTLQFKTIEAGSNPFIVGLNLVHTTMSSAAESALSGRPRHVFEQLQAEGYAEVLLTRVNMGFIKVP